MAAMNRIISILLIFSLLNSCHSNEKGMTKSERIDMFEQVWNIVNEHFYDQKFNGVDWAKKRIDYKIQVERCNNTDTLFSLLNQMLFDLNSSHCGVGLISGLDDVVSPYLFKNGEIGIDIRIIENRLVITKVQENSPAGMGNISTGYIIEKIDGLTINEIEKQVQFKPPFNNRNKKFHLTAEVLRRIYGQAGTNVKIDFADGNNQAHSQLFTRVERKNGSIIGDGLPLAYLKSESYFISKDIAYLSLNAFNPADLEHVLNNLGKVENSKGLIIDLRGNDGGSIEGMKLLLGRFVSERKKYGTYINRTERNEDFIEPIGEIYKGCLVVIVDEMSISGAENMAGIVQFLELGKVIGKQTPGQMLWGNGYILNDSVALAIPIYKMEYPNGYNPENNGIEPDVEVELNQKDLLNNKDSQLDEALKYLENNIDL